jgi:hypothetical protein
MKGGEHEKRNATVGTYAEREKRIIRDIQKYL